MAAILVAIVLTLELPSPLHADPVGTSGSADAGSPLLQKVGSREDRTGNAKLGKTAAKFSSDWKTGDEVFAIAPKLIDRIDFESTGTAIHLGRTKGPHNHFEMTVTIRATGTVEHCKADSLMRALLPALSSIRVRRTFAAAEAEALWAKGGERASLLRIQDTTETDPKVFQILMMDRATSAGSAQVAFREEDHLFVPSVGADLIKRLSAGCGDRRSRLTR